MSWEWKQVGEVKSKQQQLFSSDRWCITPLSLLESDFTDRSVQTNDQLRPSSTWFSPDPATGIKCDHLRRACSIQPRNVQELLRKQPCKKSHVLLIVLFLFLNLPLQLISRSLDDSTFTDAIEEIIGYWKLLLFTYSLKKNKKKNNFFWKRSMFWRWLWQREGGLSCQTQQFSACQADSLLMIVLFLSCPSFRFLWRLAAPPKSLEQLSVCLTYCPRLSL